jgi:hypothetical protein
LTTLYWISLIYGSLVVSWGSRFCSLVQFHGFDKCPAVSHQMV